MLEKLLQEYRTHRLARFTAWVLAYGAVLWTLDRFLRYTDGLHGLLWFIFWVGAATSGVYYLVRLLRLFRARLLWRLLPRLVVTYIFIAVVPISLILLLVFLGAFIINGQFAAFVVMQRLRDHFDEIQQINRVVLHEARFGGENSPPAMLAGIRNFCITELRGYAHSYPGLVITLQLGDVTRSFLLNGDPTENPGAVPSWVKNEYANIVSDHGRLALRSLERMTTPAGGLTLILSQPISPPLLDLVGEGVGPVGVDLYKQILPQAEIDAKIKMGGSTGPGTYAPGTAIHSDSLKLPEPRNFLDIEVFGASSMDPVLWQGDTEQKSYAPAFVYVSSRIFDLNSQLLNTLGEFSKYYVDGFYAVAIIFLLIEGMALLVGIRLTRSITGTVDMLYDATERVKAGDFTYRTRLPSHDQLTALGEAFDGMTASVQRLMQESQERLRLQSELDIAREVQRQLFPQSTPRTNGLDLFGVCTAARSVSGDYYDFLRLDEHHMGLVLGDISGKGISAALLMAALQSALRAQFYGFPDGQGVNLAHLSTAQVVERLNRQFYANTPPEKYVTFFFAIYDERTRKLSYTNAGHLPPLLFRNGNVDRLRTGGTVVGLFPSAAYEVGEIHLQPNDLLLAYTDGITEPENNFGEEFGESRLIAVATRMRDAPPEAFTTEIYRSVNEWTGSPELQDDMTLLLARAWPDPSGSVSVRV